MPYCLWESGTSSWASAKRAELDAFVHADLPVAIRKKWVTRTPGGGFELTEAGETHIKKQWLCEWFTEDIAGPKTASRRFLIRFIPTTKGVAQVRTCLRRDNFLLLQVNRNQLKDRLLEAVYDIDHAPVGFAFFEKEKDAERKGIQVRLRNLQAVDDGMKLMSFFLKESSQINDLHVSFATETLMSVLGCHDNASENGPDRVRSAIDILRSLAFEFSISHYRHSSYFVQRHEEYVPDSARHMILLGSCVAEICAWTKLEPYAFEEWQHDE